MGYKIKQISSEDWKNFSREAHLICFDENKPVEMDRIDYALLAIDETTDKPAGYVTVREITNKDVYWQYGGSFPGTRGTVKSFRVYEALHDWTSQRYERITTLIQNTNTTMIKFAMKMGYLIIGIRNFKGDVMIEHLLEFTGEE